MVQQARGAINRAVREGKPLYCDRVCMGMARRVSASQKKRRKALYDARRRTELAAEISVQKQRSAVGRAILDYVGRPYVMENVQGSVLRRDLVLCGEMFGLEVIRHRYFELGGWGMPKPAHRKHRGRVAGMRHGEWFTGPYFQVYGDGGGKGSVADWQRAMGIDWTDVRAEIAQAIPPAYSEFIGAALLSQLVGAVAA